MFTRALVAAAVMAATAASAQNYDADGDGDVDGDDWEAIQPPIPESYDETGWSQYPGEQAPAQAPTQQQLEQQVAAYGVWYEEPGVGRVWQPSTAVVGVDFTPYTTGGQWVATTGGWQFASTYRFGSAPFHYGRWHRSPRYGWVWWPQTQWAPAWVDWRCNSAGNVAWAPMAPAGLSVRFASGAPYWSFAYGRNHRANMSSFSWGRYGGWNGGWRRGGGWGRHSGWRNNDGWRGNDNRGGWRGNDNRGGGWRGNDNRGGGWRGNDNRGGGYRHQASPVNPGNHGGNGGGRRRR